MGGLRETGKHACRYSLSQGQVNLVSEDCT